MFSRLALLPIGLFVLWCIVCQQWYVCHIKQKCDEKPLVEPPPATVDNRPLVFSWSSPDPETRPAYEAYRDSVLGAVPAGKLLETVGLYFKDEPAPKGFANMGLARATKIKERLLAEVPALKAENIVASSRLVGTEPEGARTGKFVAAEFNVKDPPKGDEVDIVEVDSTITILFPYGKSTREADAKVDEYLEKLSQRLKKTGETVAITGHTDDAGTIEFNQKLGMARANHVQGILVSKGIAASRISIASKGELNPVAGNDTEEGTRQNRRVVLVLNKKK